MHDIRIAVRIPGNWAHPGELVERLPAGVQVTPEQLVLPGGEEFELIPMPPDDQFAEIFCSACRQPPSREERSIVSGYTVNIGLSGPGGSMQAAINMLQAAAAIVRAGGAGVFVDNSALAHGASLWLEMADDAGPDAVSFAFAAIVSSQQDVYTVGMHTMGFPDLILRTGDDRETAGETLVETLRYVCGEEKPVAHGHILMDATGPRYQCNTADGDDFPSSSPVHNPFGRLRLVPVEDIAEGN